MSIRRTFSIQGQMTFLSCRASRAAAALVVLLSAQAIFCAGDGVRGVWREPGGSVIRIADCGKDICASIIAISTAAPEKIDSKNPDAALRTRELCGLAIGYGFHLVDPSHASGGKLYDPKSGKTYRGMMIASGNTLHLRGYVGIKTFGRTEDWIRADNAVITCRKP